MIISMRNEQELRVEQKEEKSLLLPCLLLFIFGLLYVTTYACGLYFDTHGKQDFEFIQDAADLKIGTMVGDLFFPGLDFFRGAHAQGVQTRIVEAFVLKGIHALFDWEPFPYFFFKGIFIALTTVILFILLHRSTKSTFFAVLGSLFFMSVPSVFSSLLFMYDFGIIAEFFIIVAFLLFVQYELGKERIKAKGIQWKYIIALCLITLFGLKTKVSTVIIPVVIFIYLFLFMRKKFLSYSPYFIFAFLFINPFYPLFHDQGVQLGSLPVFRISYLYERVFLNRAWDYNGDQEVPVIFSLKESIVRMPNTVTAAFGFFFFWFLVMCFLYLLYKEGQMFRTMWKWVWDNTKFEESGCAEFKFSLFYFIWFCSVLFFYQFDVMKNPLYSGTDMRYMTLAIVPLFLLCFTYFSYIIENLPQKRWMLLGKEWSPKEILKWCFVFLLLPTIIVNVAHSTVHLRGGYNAHNYANVELFKILYRDFSGTEISTDDFSRNNLYYQQEDDLLINRTFTNYDFLDFAAYKMPMEENAIYMELQKQGNNKTVFYGVSLGEQKAFSSLNVVLLKKIDVCGIGFYEKMYCILYQKKNNKPFVFYVYTIALRK